MVSNAIMLHEEYGKDQCPKSLPEGAVEIEVLSADIMTLHKGFLTKRGTDGSFSNNDDLRHQGFDLPRLYPDNGVPFVFQYSLRNATYSPPHVPHIRAAYVDWPENNKIVYVNFFDQTFGWPVAGIYYESASHRPSTWVMLPLYLADAIAAPLVIVLALALGGH